jgi:hypothetical protein
VTVAKDSTFINKIQEGLQEECPSITNEELLKAMNTMFLMLDTNEAAIAEKTNYSWKAIRQPILFAKEHGRDLFWCQKHRHAWANHFYPSNLAVPEGYMSYAEENNLGDK